MKVADRNNQRFFSSQNCLTCKCQPFKVDPAASRYFHGQKINSVIFTLAQTYLSGIISYRRVVSNSSKICIAYPSKGHLRSPEVTNSHLPIIFNQKEIETWDWCQYLRSSWPGKSTDMQYDPFRSSRDLGLTWPEVKLWPWPFKVILYMVRRASTKQTRWYQIRCSTFKIKVLLSKNRFGKFWNFDPWWPKFWPESKNDRNDFEMIFRELSNAAFRFSLRRPEAEIMGGGGFKRPPPPQQAVENPEAQQGAG